MFKIWWYSYSWYFKQFWVEFTYHLTQVDRQAVLLGHSRVCFSRGRAGRVRTLKDIEQSQSKCERLEGDGHSCSWGNDQSRSGIDAEDSKEERFDDGAVVSSYDRGADGRGAAESAEPEQEEGGAPHGHGWIIQSFALMGKTLKSPKKIFLHLFWYLLISIFHRASRVVPPWHNL